MILTRLFAPFLPPSPGVGGSDRKVWFFGPSGIGKKSLIYELSHLLNKRNCSLSRAIEIKPREPVVPIVLDNRISGKTALETRRMRQDRHAVVQKIYSTDLGVTWLIHGQAIDLKEQFLPRFAARLGGKLPNSKGVYLVVEEETFLSRRKKVRQSALTYREAYKDQEETLASMERVFPEVILHHL